MKSLVIVVCLYNLASCLSEALPTFTWQSEKSEFGIPFLRIDFNDGSDDSDTIVLRRINPIPVDLTERSDDVDGCIYNGFLIDEPDVPATVTGCPSSDNMLIQLSSRRLAHDMFKVVNGKTIGLEQTLRSHLARDLVEQRRTPFNREDYKPLNPNGYTANIRVSYDDNFDEKFGSDAKNAIRRILAHTQHVWKWPSLTTKVIFKVDPVVTLIHERWTANHSLEAVGRNYSKDLRIHSHMYFGVQNENSGSALGIAYLGGACSYKPYRHSLVMEYQDDDLTFARSLAHEFGHNLNMNHDFGASEKIPRFDSKGNNCTGIGSIMDYAKGGIGDKRQWSTCSIEDMTKMVNDQPECLPEIDPENPPEEIPDEQISKRECDMNKLKPGHNGYDFFNYSGIKCEVLCINGICAPKGSCFDKNLTACQSICGNDSCDDAKEPTPCDMTKFGYDGRYGFCYDGNKLWAMCTEGLCLPKSYDAKNEGPMTNACLQICGQESCESRPSNCGSSH